jgi:hypothetical protein
MKKLLLFITLSAPATIYVSLAFLACFCYAMLIIAVHIMDTINKKIDKYLK